MGNGQKILLVDDDPAILEFLSILFEKNGFTVFKAMDGVQAMELAMKQKPNLILLDIMMPAGSGLSVYGRLKQSILTKGIPIVFLTAMPVDQAREKLPPDDTSLIFGKPCRPEEILSQVKKTLGID